MDKRELYKQKADAQIREWSAKLDALKAHTDKLTAQTKLDVQPRVDTVHKKFAAAQAKLAKIEEATDEKLDELFADIDSAWNDFKSALEGTFDAIKAHT